MQTYFYSINTRKGPLKRGPSPSLRDGGRSPLGVPRTLKIKITKDHKRSKKKPPALNLNFKVPKRPSILALRLILPPPSQGTSFSVFS